jgi:FKBP-type peptidyl-prolyl cis-trans isomerase (trigger factor)
VSEKKPEQQVKFNVEQRTPTERVVKVTIPPEAVKSILDAKIETIRRSAVVKGFRKGKAPVSVIRRIFLDRLLAETEKQLVEANTPIILDHELVDKATIIEGSEAVTRKLKTSEKKGITYEIHLQTKPRPEPGSIVDFSKPGGA